MKSLETTRLPVFGITLVYEAYTGVRTITSDLHDEDASAEYTAAINALESFILAAWSAGVEVDASEFLEAIETSVEAIVQRYD